MIIAYTCGTFPTTRLSDLDEVGRVMRQKGVWVTMEGGTRWSQRAQKSGPNRFIKCFVPVLYFFLIMTGRWGSDGKLYIKAWPGARETFFSPLSRQAVVHRTLRLFHLTMTDALGGQGLMLSNKLRKKDPSPSTIHPIQSHPPQASLLLDTKRVLKVLLFTKPLVPCAQGSFPPFGSLKYPETHHPFNSFKPLNCMQS